jgi:hypothetical protein
MVFNPSTVIRQGLAAYLTAAAIPNMVQFYTDQPFDLGDVPWSALQPPGASTTGIGILYIDSDDDRFTTMDGAGGGRVVTYQMSLDIMLTDVSGLPSGASQAMDNVIDAIKFRVRSDPVFGINPVSGTNQEILQGGIRKLNVERGRPVILGNGHTWAMWASIHLSVESWEIST